MRHINNNNTLWGRCSKSNIDINLTGKLILEYRKPSSECNLDSRILARCHIIWGKYIHPKQYSIVVRHLKANKHVTVMRINPMIVHVEKETWHFKTTFLSIEHVLIPIHTAWHIIKKIHLMVPSVTYQSHLHVCHSSYPARTTCIRIR